MTNEEQIAEKCRKFLFDGQPDGQHGNLDNFVEIMTLVWKGMQIWHDVDKQDTANMDEESFAYFKQELLAKTYEMDELYKNHSREVVSAVELILNPHYVHKDANTSAFDAIVQQHQQSNMK